MPRLGIVLIVASFVVLTPKRNPRLDRREERSDWCYADRHDSRLSEQR